MGLLTIFIYQTSTGKKPYLEWLNKLDESNQGIVESRIARVRLGNFGDCKLLKGYPGLWELRLAVGPGYRIYFGKKGNQIIVFLTGGDKKSQSRDIEKSYQYWLQCKESL